MGNAVNVNDLKAYATFAEIMDAPDLPPSSRAGAGLTPTGDLGRAPARLSLGELVEVGCWLALGFLVLYMLLRWVMS